MHLVTSYDVFSPVRGRKLSSPVDEQTVQTYKPCARFRAIPLGDRELKGCLYLLIVIPLSHRLAVCLRHTGTIHASCHAWIECRLVLA